MVLTHRACESNGDKYRVAGETAPAGALAFARLPCIPSGSCRRPTQITACTKRLILRSSALCHLWFYSTSSIMNIISTLVLIKRMTSFCTLTYVRTKTGLKHGGSVCITFQSLVLRNVDSLAAQAPSSSSSSESKASTTCSGMLSRRCAVSGTR